MSVVPDRGSPTTNTGSSLSKPKPRTRAKNSGVQTAIIRVTRNSYSCGSYSSAAFAPIGLLQRIAAIEVLGSLGILAPRIEDLSQSEVQQQSLCVRQLLAGGRTLLQQAALRSQILLRKPAAQELRQLVMCEGEAGVVPQGGAEGIFRALKIASLLQIAPQVAVSLGIIRLQFQCPALAGDRFVRISLLLEGNAQVVVCLGIVRLQFQGPAAAGDRFVQLPLFLEDNAQVVVPFGIVRLQFQRPAVAGKRFVQFRPAPASTLPRLLWASA